MQHLIHDPNFKLPKGKIVIITRLPNDDLRKKIFAKPVLGGIFAYHKCPWRSFYTITHVGSGVPLISGKRTNILKAMEYLEANMKPDQFIDPHCKDSNEFMKGEDKATIATLWETYKIGNGRN